MRPRQMNLQSCTPERQFCISSCDIIICSYSNLLQRFLQGPGLSQMPHNPIPHIKIATVKLKAWVQPQPHCKWCAGYVQWRSQFFDHDVFFSPLRALASKVLQARLAVVYFQARMAPADGRPGSISWKKRAEQNKQNTDFNISWSQSYTEIFIVSCL